MLELVHPGAPARAPALVDSPTPKDSPIFIRGQAETPGDIVPRRFLEVLSGPNRPAFHNGSGRLELAQAIANKNNPLTARVLVNRVWLHHFGEGFVTTPDDFGNQSAPPSHPELLDYLASRFMADGWSIKKLHKLIVLSATYQQSTREQSGLRGERSLQSSALARQRAAAGIRAVARFDSLPRRQPRPDGGRPSRGSVRRHAQVAEARRRGHANRMREFRLPSAPRRTIYGYVDRARSGRSA